MPPVGLLLIAINKGVNEIIDADVTQISELKLSFKDIFLKLCIQKMNAIDKTLFRLFIRLKKTCCLLNLLGVI